MSINYNKKRYLQLLEENRKGDKSNSEELLEYSCMLNNQLKWEVRDQYLLLMEKFLNDEICMADFLAQLRLKGYAIMDASTFLEKCQIILSFDKKATKFGELIMDLNDEIETDFSCIGDDFTNLIQEYFIKIKKYLNEE